MICRAAPDNKNLFCSCKFALHARKAAEFRSLARKVNPAAYGVPDSLRLVKNFLQHKMRELAFLRLLYRPVDLLRLAGEFLIEKIYYSVSRPHEYRNFPFFQINDFARVLQ